jgi:hypothetical protein
MAAGPRLHELNRELNELVKEHRLGRKRRRTTLHEMPAVDDMSRGAARQQTRARVAQRPQALILQTAQANAQTSPDGPRRAQTGPDGRRRAQTGAQAQAQTEPDRHRQGPDAHRRSQTAQASAQAQAQTGPDAPRRVQTGADKHRRAQTGAQIQAQTGPDGRRRAQTGADGRRRAQGPRAPSYLAIPAASQCIPAHPSVSQRVPVHPNEIHPNTSQCIPATSQRHPSNIPAGTSEGHEVSFYWGHACHCMHKQTHASTSKRHAQICN